MTIEHRKISKFASIENLLFLVGFSLVGFAGIFLTFRPYFETYGDLIAGNFGDARLVVYLLEHWHRVFIGIDQWMSPAFFYPTTGVLGYSDSLFIHALPYSFFRAIGLDNFSAFEWTLIVFYFMGYASMVFLIRRSFNAPKFLAIAGGALFAFSNLEHIWVLSPQLILVLLIPVWFLILHEIIFYRNSNARLSTVLAASLGAGASLAFFSGFYAAWFLTFFLAVVFIVVCTYLVFTKALSGRYIKKYFAQLVAFSLFALIFAVPFLMTYMPLASQDNVRSLKDVLSTLPKLKDLVDLGNANLLWGKLINISGEQPWTYGMAPIQLTVFAACSFFLFLECVFNRKSSHLDKLACFVGISVFVIWACLLLEPIWALIWQVVPGAKVIRVLHRYQLTLNFFVVLTSVFGISKFWRGKREGAKRAFLALLIAVLCIEQINLLDTHAVSLSEEKRILAEVENPPSVCKSFFLLPSPFSTFHPIGIQVSAMLISQHIGLPTLNGYSGLQPVGWDLNIPTSADYISKAEKWSKKNVLTDVCRFDQQTQKWSVNPFVTPNPFTENGGKPPVFASDNPDIYTQVGIKKDQKLFSTGKGGYLQYGPYMFMPKGNYVVSWKGQLLSSKSKDIGRVEVSVKGSRVSESAVVADNVKGNILATLPFNLSTDVDNFEFVFVVQDDVQLFLTEISVQPFSSP